MPEPTFPPVTPTKTGRGKTPSSRARPSTDAPPSASPFPDDPFVTHADAATPTGGRRNRKKRTPTPPFDLPPHEQYFWQNRPGRQPQAAARLNTLPSLDHEAYFESIAKYQDPNRAAYEELHDIHTRSFAQWYFELCQSYNICLYGYGSKRRLVSDFARYLHQQLAPAPKILIINGYNTTLDLRKALVALATLAFDAPEGDLPPRLLGAQPATLVASIVDHLQKSCDQLFIFINSLDAASIRRPSSNASLLAQLAACSSIHMLATCDTMNFALLWPSDLRDKYNWVFHDTTTFVSFGGVEIATVVDDVNELLGRSTRRVKGKEGVGFVLKSLPENARNLYRMLLTDLLASDEDQELDPIGNIEARLLYQKATEEFICSHEMGFRQLLKEFYDHDMLITRRDVNAGGLEILTVPFRRDECLMILEELG